MEGPDLLQLCLQRRYAPRVPEPFRHRIRVRFNECDGQGVVFYANYLVYFDLAMTELWREAFGSGYAGMIASGTDGWSPRRTIRYRPRLASTTSSTWSRQVTRIGNTSSTTRLSAERVPDGRECSRRRDLRHVFIDPRTLREDATIPEQVRTGLERYAA